MKLNISFKDIQTRSELAAALGVRSEALDLVALTGAPCKRDGCMYTSAANNQKLCVCCSQTWYPRLKTASGAKAVHCRGHGLYGPQFMRLYNGSSSSPPPPCCCTLAKCEEIGYSHDGMFRLPTDPLDCRAALDALQVTPERKEEILADPRNFFVAPWHVDPKHRVRCPASGNWIPRKRLVYKDEDRKSFNTPPPNYSPQRFIDTEIRPANLAQGRGGNKDESLPYWVRLMARAERDQQDSNPSSGPTIMLGAQKNRTPRKAQNKRQKTPNAPCKRANPHSLELEDAKEEIKLLQAKLNSALQHIEGLTATVTIEKGERIKVQLERDQLKEENAELKAKVEQLEKQLEESQCVLSYEDLKPGGALSHYVNDFTFFPDFASNDAFLDLINYTEGCEPGDGLCENMVRYSKVTMEERKRHNDELRGASKVGSDSGLESSDKENTSADDMSICSDRDNKESDMEEDYMEAFEPDTDNASRNENGDDTCTTSRRGRKRKLAWKTEWLIYNFYVRSNISMRRVAALFGTGATTVHDIVYAWANVLCLTLKKFFPTPTRSQMLRAYPVSVIKKFGHANIFMLLDATESFAEIASMKTVNSVLFSSYKHNSTLKWLVGSDPIGMTWDDSISYGYGGTISDPISTAVSNILDQVPYGCAVEVDKGFLIDNECALLSIVCIRPMKMLEKQTQQSKEDAALTQKVGKTRIPIEQANGQMKRGTAFFDSRIRISQIGLADLIFRSSYLLQNFKLGFIQERDATDELEGRPCKAEIRWYGATDDGLHDVRPDVDLWGMEVEIERWNELRKLPANKNLTDTEISELVLNEDWPLRLRAELESKVEG